jgi:hypothetical protein
MKLLYVFKERANIYRARMAYLVIIRHLAPGQITYLVSGASPILI